MAELSAHEQAFEAVVKVQGPEAAFHTWASALGEAAAHERASEYEKRYGVMPAFPGSPLIGHRGSHGAYAGPAEGDRFWPALRAHLLANEGWPAERVDTLDQESTLVVRHLQPSPARAGVRGLVIGQSQRGNAANYSALVAKAADVGFRLVIVLVGSQPGLRRRTQEGLEARLVRANRDVQERWHTLTTPLEDFRAPSTNADAYLSNQGHQRVLLVVEKSAPVLEHVASWLARAQPRILRACPALLVEDEVDLAGSSDGVEAEHTNATNQVVLGLMRTLPRSACVGYTTSDPAHALAGSSGTDFHPGDFIITLAGAGPGEPTPNSPTS